MRIGAFFLVAFTVFPTAHAEESATAKSKPTVYIRITREKDLLDKAVENVYAKKFTIVEARNSKEFTSSIVRESVPRRPVISESGQELRGDVLVEIIVTSDGRPIEPVILKSADKRLNVAALDAVKQWRFMPARLNGSPVSEALYVLFADAAKADQQQERNTIRRLTISTPQPEYPQAARLLRITGNGLFIMRVQIASGRVKQVTVLRTTGNNLLDAAAIKGLTQWQFKPGALPSIKRHYPSTKEPNEECLIPVPVDFVLVKNGVIMKGTVSVWRP